MYVLQSLQSMSHATHPVLGKNSMEVRNLKTFLTVAKLSSFRQAAERLNYAQSSISSQIIVLEEEVGTPLFQRQGRSIALSAAGKKLFRYAQKIVEVEREAFAAASSAAEPRGLISLRIPQSLGTYYLPAIIEMFRARHSKVDFDVSSCEYQMLPHELKSGTTDLAFLLADSVDFSELKTEFLGAVTLSVVAPPTHSLTRYPSISTRDLKNQPIILPKHDCSYKMAFEELLAEEKVRPGTVIEMNSIEAIKHCVMKGLGIAMIPDIAVSAEIGNGRLVPLNWPEDALETAVLMIWHQEKWLSQMLKEFMNIARKIFRSM